MSNKRAPPDLVLARIAGRQHGVVTTRQLSLAGIDRHAAQRRMRAGRLHRIHQGVYAVGHGALCVEARWMAAVLACGKRAVLSHRSAAALWRLLPAEQSFIEISVAGRGGRRRRAGVRIHRPRALPAGEITLRLAIPVTTPARTINDLRGAIPEGELRRAIRQAEVLGLPLEVGIETELTRSELEDRFLTLCRRHRLPTPEVNARVGDLTVDFLWRRNFLIVETDGYRFHRGRQAFEDDRTRDLQLKRLGFEVVRLTHRQVTGHAVAVAATLRALLGRAPGVGR